MSEQPPSGSMPAAQSASMVGEVIHNYRIARKLGEGGMGEVYAAEHIHIAKRIAIKLLRPEIVSNKEAVDRFYQEARSASSIGHKNIIAIDDFGKLPDGRIYMFMELLGGAPLNDMIKSPMPVDRLLNILIQTGHGLAAAHAKGITHRDMKPENIFVTQGPNGEDIPKLLDFGIAKVAGNDGQNNLTKTGTIFGTPFYMAPEQALGQQVDARADIYAMGVIMYEVFSGTLPFQGESFMGILTQHITTEPEPVAQRAAAAGRQLPPGLADVISRCMQKDPNRRYPTMDALVQALVDVYRQIAGAGMSSYMEAFAVPRTGAHTPQVGTGPYGMPPPPASLQTVVAPGGTGGMQGMHGMQGMAPQPHPGHSTGHPMVGGSGPVGMSGTPGSGLYAAGASGLVEVAPKKSKAGLIFALIAVLAAAGGIVAFVVLGNKKKDDAENGSNGSGSALVATADASGAGSNGSNGSAGTTVAGTPDAAPVATGTPDAAQVAATTPDAAQVAAATPDAAGSTPPKAEPIMVLVDSKNVTKFDVFQGSKKIGTGATVVKVEPGTPVTITLKAKGYKDKTVVLDGKETKVEERLEPKAGSGNNGSGAPKLDCRHALKDPSNADCKKQYCDDVDHFSNPACMQ